jgi:hypothetical protein
MLSSILFCNEEKLQSVNGERAQETVERLHCIDPDNLIGREI